MAVSPCWVAKPVDYRAGRRYPALLRIHGGAVYQYTHEYELELGSEQMYQALRSLGLPTELVIYPGEWHPLTVPSYIRDRTERQLG